jgi:hypothetical protein
MARVGHARGCGPIGERRELGRAQEKHCDFFYLKQIFKLHKIFSIKNWLSLIQKISNKI